ncbi:hypothetical protein ZIOFF_065274 [Zingiber officinale]|uniref:Uncharacterized protein n=1 Tax=Zingiber officinale TaxID=94328 RepID=A0A8J5K718_ZINOF|nr:hypothetical protein ZIOFF_065274 [Zingiber officinale]
MVGWPAGTSSAAVAWPEDSPMVEVSPNRRKRRRVCGGEPEGCAVGEAMGVLICDGVRSGEAISSGACGSPSWVGGRLESLRRFRRTSSGESPAWGTPSSAGAEETGSASTSVEADWTDQSQRKDRITVFNETHYSSKKGWIGDMAKTAYDDMVRLRDECILSQNSEDVIDVVQIADTVCDQVNVNPLSKSMNELSISGSKCLDVFYTHCLSCPSQEEHHGGSAVENRSSACLVLGTRSGYIRGLGSGPKSVRSTSSDATSSSRSTNAVLRERLQSTQDELANTKFQLANTQDELASIKSRQDLFEQILNRLAPVALDSLIHNSSSAPPPPPPS